MFHNKLGSQGDKVLRISALSQKLANRLKCDVKTATKGAEICKCDLASEMVYEFPELQGVMGRYYAIEAGEDACVADAIRDHYKPQGPSDAVPSDAGLAALAQAETLFDHLQVQNRTPRRVGRLVSHDAGMLEVTGFRRPIGSGARVMASDGSICRAEVVGFRGDRTLLVPLDADAPLENGIRVEPDSQANMVQVGDGLIGRVIDAMGQPLDRKGPIIAGGVWPLNGVKGNVLDRGRVTEPFDLGVQRWRLRHRGLHWDDPEQSSSCLSPPPSHQGTRNAPCTNACRR